MDLPRDGRATSARGRPRPKPQARRPRARRRRRVRSRSHSARTTSWEALVRRSGGARQARPRDEQKGGTAEPLGPRLRATRARHTHLPLRWCARDPKALAAPGPWREAWCEPGASRPGSLLPGEPHPPPKRGALIAEPRDRHARARPLRTGSLAGDREGRLRPEAERIRILMFL
eukprot:scaffold116194_cov61-Phaeocystis_antarctica.AAC.1